MPVAVPTKLALTVRRTPKRSAMRPLPMMLIEDSMPRMPKVVAAVSGEKPASTRKATSCTTIANMPLAVQKNTCASAQ